MVCEFQTEHGECGRTANAEMPDGTWLCLYHLADWIAQQLVKGEYIEDDAK